MNRLAALVALALAGGCARTHLASNVWYESAEIACLRQNCPRCHGTRGIQCPKCHGTGTIECTSCDKSGQVTCGTCKGDGRKDGKKCKTCDGLGKHACWTCGGDKLKDDDYCAAKGKILCLMSVRVSEPPVTQPGDIWPPQQ